MIKKKNPLNFWNVFPSSLFPFFFSFFPSNAKFQSNDLCPAEEAQCLLVGCSSRLMLLSLILISVCFFIILFVS